MQAGSDTYPSACILKIKASRTFYIYKIYYKGEKEGYQVRCSAKEKEVPLIELTMTVPTKAAAEAVCASWQTKNKAVYEKLLDMLM